MTKLAAALLGLALLCLTANSVSAQDASAGQWREQVARVNVVLWDGRPFCSGSFISIKHRLVLTANHCIRDAFRKEIKEEVGSDGTVRERIVQKADNIEIVQNIYDEEGRAVSSQHYVTVIKQRDADTDTAILQVLDKGFTAPAELKLAASDKVALGDRVYALGNTFGELDNSLTQGVVTYPALRRIKIGDLPDAPYIQTDVPSGPGNSGGAVLNANGEIIGTVTGGATGIVTFVAPVSKIKALLKKANFADVFETVKPNPNPSSRTDDK